MNSNPIQNADPLNKTLGRVSNEANSLTINDVVKFKKSFAIGRLWQVFKLGVLEGKGLVTEDRINLILSNNRNNFVNYTHASIRELRVKSALNALESQFKSKKNKDVKKHINEAIKKSIDKNENLDILKDTINIILKNRFIPNSEKITDAIINTLKATSVKKVSIEINDDLAATQKKIDKLQQFINYIKAI